jgi:hypothetical protein
LRWRSDLLGEHRCGLPLVPQSAKSGLTDLLMFKAVFRIDQFRIEVFQLPLPPPRLSFAVRVSRRT